MLDLSSGMFLHCMYSTIPTILAASWARAFADIYSVKQVDSNMKL
jgi:hypothetical protein